MIESKDKLVSIGLPIFNGASTMRRAIDSLLAQSYDNFELIISDNASEDNTQEICQAYAQKDPRVKYIRQDRNIGMIDNFYHFVTSQAGGSYFMWASDDDWWHPDFIKTLMKALEENKSHGVAMGSLQLSFNDGELFDEVNFTRSNNPSMMDHSQLFNRMLAKNTGLRLFIYGLFRMEVIRKLMWQPVPTVIGPDKIIMSEAALFTRFYAAPEILLKRTVHRKPEIERWDGDDYKKAFMSSRAYNWAIMTWCKRLYQSPNISWLHKIKLLPGKTVLLYWVYRKYIFRELWPSGFNFLRKVVKYKFQ